MVFAADHRIGLVLTVEQSNPDADLDRIRLTIDPQGSTLTLPLQAAPASMRTAGPADTVKARVKAHPEPENDPEKLMRQFLETSR